MNPYLPADKQNIDDSHEMDLHEEAGLLFNGVDEDGQQEWIGSQEQWSRYNKLVKDFEEYENMA